MKKTIAVSIILAAGAGAVTTGFFLANSFPGSGANATGEGGSAGQREPLYWVAPMDPDFRREGPGLSPMGMELVPVYEEQGGNANTITVSSAVQQNLGLRTASVVREDFSREISTVGYTRWDGSTIQMLHPRAEGWLEVFNLSSVGDRVEAGQVIYELFAPNLVSVQREFLNVRQNPALAGAARDRLQALGFTAAQIEELEQSGEISRRLRYRASMDGVVTEIGVREGSYVQPGSNIATLASLDTIWIDAEVFESDAGALAAGQNATVTFPAFPGEVREGAVAYVYPELDADTRTLRIRLAMDNPGHRLKPNMFANVVVEGAPRRDVLTVAREAVIRSGAGSRVILALPEGRFRVQPVVTGISSDGRTEIVEGLEEGDVVVTSGQFLLDSEANGEQAVARLEGGMEMEGMEMEGMEMSSPSDAGPFSTTGTITRINEGRVTISHAPVEALAWPSMEMGFEVSPAISLEDINVDDAVRFEFERMENGGYRVVGIEETGGNSDD